ncbi:hypothetical protein IE53DRAFT_126005 [Violaceomyces palustris]|uniref:Uncharacterized protein n=1 Tax=Violaceomyces palustris TaxID=1673888 RepID=A0ACD0NVL0_9BASI|nr:hypothetical protein IE53DRAFT_126005 [Violaceomyces palustris]
MIYQEKLPDLITYLYDNELDGFQRSSAEMKEMQMFFGDFMERQQARMKKMVDDGRVSRKGWKGWRSEKVKGTRRRKKEGRKKKKKKKERERERLRERLREEDKRE